MVVLHDAVLDRTTDGAGPVRFRTLAEVQALDAGFGFIAPEGGHPWRGRGLRIPTLDELLVAQPGVPLNIEVKQQEPPIDEAVLAVLDRHGARERTLLAAEHVSIMTRIREAAPDVLTSCSAAEAVEFVFRLRDGTLSEWSSPAVALQVPPRYQDIDARDARLLSSPDGGALVRVIAGTLAGHDGPGVTYTPITYLHATVSPGARLDLPWPRDFNAMVYVLSGRGTIAVERRPLDEGQLGVFGPGEALTVHAADVQPANSPTGWEILVLGGLPLHEPVARYGPFVMNTRQEIVTAIEDFQAGRLGQIPAEHLAHRGPTDEKLP